MSRSLQHRFGQVIRQRRLKLGLSQEAFANQAGLHRTYVSLLERGERNPSLAVIEVLSTALGASMHELLGDVETTSKHRQ